jgi:hypothetical protein
MLKSMKKIRPIGLLLAISLISICLLNCSKAKEDLKKSVALQVMTSGRWIVQEFSESSTDKTSLFTPYEFQFFDNGSVNAYFNGQTNNGSWVGDAKAGTISANFPTGNDTLILLNDTWKIDNSTLTSVDATPSNSSRTAVLKLLKK